MLRPFGAAAARALTGLARRFSSPDGRAIEVEIAGADSLRRTDVAVLLFRIARELLVRGVDYFRAYICENLGGKDERITNGELSEIQAMTFDPMNDRKACIKGWIFLLRCI